MKTRPLNVALPVPPVGTIAHAVDELPKIEKEIEARLKVWLEREMKSQKERMDEWSAKFAANPVFALEWSDSTFEYATRWEVNLMVFQTIFERDEGIEFRTAFDRTLRWLETEVKRMARFPSMSTSHCSNLIAIRKAQSYAEVLDKLEWYLREMK